MRSRPQLDLSISARARVGLALAVLLLVPLAAPAALAATEPAATRIIVRFVPGSTAQEQSQILADHGVRAVSWVPALDLVIGDLTASDPTSALIALFGEPSVRSADLDRTRTASGTFGSPSEDPGWATRRIGVGDVDPEGFSTLAILDTGVDASDPNLMGQVMQGWSAFGHDELTDPNGHGTAVAEIAAASSFDHDRVSGVAPHGVFVLPMQVLDSSGVGSDSDIIRGIVGAVERGADVILMSFAGAGYSIALQAAVDFAWSSGAVLVAPVGEGVASSPLFPAAASKVIGVSATTPIDSLWEDSNRGPSAFIAAPGTEVLTSGGSFSGTAAAAAIVAGGAALLSSLDDDASNATIVGRLARGAAPVGPRAEVGNGRLDMAASMADRSEAGLTPVGSLDGGGPYVTSYSDGALPLAGFSGEALVPVDATAPLTVEVVAASAPVLVLIAAIALLLIGRRPLAQSIEVQGAVMQMHSFRAETHLRDAIASDHGVFTYGSVSPPALRFGDTF